MPIGSCSKEQQRIYKDWFSIADSDGDGRVTGNDAIKFFTMSKLPRQVLKQIWTFADSKRQGFLGLTEFIVAMQLVSLAQKGQEITSDVLESSVDTEYSLPEMEGLDTFVAVTPPNAYTSIVDGLKRFYDEKLRPLEATYRFDEFVSPFLTNSDFDAKPMVMLLGQYSTGKTTFIKHLLQCDYPGAGPSTGRFVVVMSGPDKRRIPGNTVTVQADLPFGGLTKFGAAFLSKFECSQMPHPLLDEITFVDTPGILSGEKQTTQRNYDFNGVISWFAAKCDLILLLFDPHKLDISDEFKQVFSSLRGNDEKIRVVLNKVHQVDTQLMKVYGDLMWNLGKVVNTPEVVPVYIGSFDDGLVNQVTNGLLGRDQSSFSDRLVNQATNGLLERDQSSFSDRLVNQATNDQASKDILERDQSSFSDRLVNQATNGLLGRDQSSFRLVNQATNGLLEKDELLKELKDIPLNTSNRRINDFLKRATAAKIHAYIIGHLKKKMPAIIGKAKAQKRLLRNLQDEFGKIQREFHLAAGDFPSVEHYRKVLNGSSFDKFEKLKPKMIEEVVDMLTNDIQELLKKFRNP